MKQICILTLALGAAAMASCSRDVSPEGMGPSMVFRVCDQNRWNCRTPPADILAALNVATQNGPVELEGPEGGSVTVGDTGTVMIPPGTRRARGHIVPLCVDGAISPPGMATFVNWMNRTFPGGRSQACGRESYDWKCDGPWTNVTERGVILCRWIYEPDDPWESGEEGATGVQQDLSGTRF